jgi:hypothetical protein
VWVTRQSVRVNRTATAWFIRRFVDPAPRFVFAAAEDVAGIERMTGAVGFDAPGVRYPHRDEAGRCSFEAMVATYRPRDPALADMARIVHGADFADAIDTTPESAGLRAISRGFPLVAHDDYETIDRATFLYDALYAALRERHADAPVSSSTPSHLPPPARAP